MYLENVYDGRTGLIRTVAQTAHDLAARRGDDEANAPPARALQGIAERIATARETGGGGGSRYKARPFSVTLALKGHHVPESVWWPVLEAWLKSQPEIIKAPARARRATNPDNPRRRARNDERSRASARVREPEC